MHPITTPVVGTRPRSRRPIAAAVVALLALGLLAMGFAPYGTDVEETVPGPFAFFDPLQTLGPPTGLGRFMGTSDVYSLGVGGSITIELAGRIEDLPGADLVVYENPFTQLGTLNRNWVEACLVEVSSDGESWARFPARYLGPVGPHITPTGLDDAANSSWFRGLAGVFPVSAAPLNGGADPFDIVAGGGDVFDLEDLQFDPAVIAGDVDVQSIAYVRLLDVVGGSTLDFVGNPIWDCGKPAVATADIDAVLSLNDPGSFSADRPYATLVKRPDKVMELRLWDADGLNDIKTGISMSIDGVPVDFYSFLNLWTIVVTPTEAILRLGPIPDAFPLTTVRINVRDASGQTGGDELHLP